MKRPTKLEEIFIARKKLIDAIPSSSVTKAKGDHYIEHTEELINYMSTLEQIVHDKEEKSAKKPAEIYKIALEKVREIINSVLGFNGPTG